MKQKWTEGIQDYIQRVVRLAESAYVGVDGGGGRSWSKTSSGNFYWRSKGSGYKDGSDEGGATNIRCYLSESVVCVEKENFEYEDEPMEICHCHRWVPIEAVSPATSNDNHNNCKRRNKNNIKGSNNGGKIQNSRAERERAHY